MLWKYQTGQYIFGEGGFNDANSAYDMFCLDSVTTNLPAECKGDSGGLCVEEFCGKTNGPENVEFKFR